MTAVPALMPVTSPVPSTAATFSLEEVQVIDWSTAFQGVTRGLSSSVLPTRVCSSRGSSTAEMQSVGANRSFWGS